MFGSASSAALSFRAIASVTFFSYVPRRPIAPGSSPPWPGIDGDRDSSRRDRARRRQRLGSRGRWTNRAAAVARASFLLSAFQERHQRIERRQRIEIDDQTMAEFRDRLQCEHLRIHFRLEVEDDAKKSARRRADADPGRRRDRSPARALRDREAPGWGRPARDRARRDADRAA